MSALLILAFLFVVIPSLLLWLGWLIVGPIAELDARMRADGRED